ncbi:hypothetical protein CEP52_012471 [Fusarium oligoseptatum]|uniref:FAD-binding domain-containing protein n=1 Tax=Fusarium oligoseptatum TaxID=2604345 RepID=A0A428SYC7_9HYPO|nr:hypothetical protein CEP52_012471 [Fusarium oligoseptatum]
MASAKEFKVIIAGGGIAGLTLANTLEKFDLDYVVLECHSEISPAVGASIESWINSAVTSPSRNFLVGASLMRRLTPVTKNGQVTYDMPGFFNHLEKCAVRGVMTALGNKLEPGYFDSKEPESVPCYYCCSFGIARGVPGWTSGEQHVGTGRGRSQLVVSGPEDRVYWFMFKKLPETKYGKDIPWYSKEDEAEFVKRNWSTPITPTVSFGQVFNSRVSSTLTPLHEMVYKKWFFKRIITFGDSAHKPNPIGGQGANGAMESCAELMNALLRTRDSRGGHLTSLTDEEIEGIFNRTQSARHVRAVEIVKRAHD